MNNIQSNAPGRLVGYLVAAAAVFIILGGIRGAASIINPILLAVVITVTALPVPSLLTKRGVPGWLALVLTILMVVVLLVLVIWTVFFSITRLSATLPTYMAGASHQAAADLSSQPTTTVQVEQVITSIGPIATSLLSAAMGFVVQFGWALVIFFFMISAALAMPAPSRLGLDPNTPVLGRIATLTEDVRKYMTVLTGVNFMVGLGNTIFLMIMGVDYAVLWGMLAWFMGYIPSVGFLIALVPPVLLAYAQYGLQSALIVLIGYILINGGVQNIIQPKIMGNSLKISPVVVFVGVFIWGYMLGGMGAILAVPMTLLVIIILENFEGTRSVAILMRFTGQENKEERKEAAERVQGWWGKAKDTLRPGRDSKPPIDKSSDSVK